jgi:hypothetical protein
MRDSYEPPADHRPWQARRPDWAADSQRQDHSAGSGQPPAPLPENPVPLPGWAGRNLGQDLMQSPDPSGRAIRPAHDTQPGHYPGHGDPFGLSPVDRTVPDLYHPGRGEGYAAQGGSLERRPDNWPAYDPYQRHPSHAGPPPYPARPAPFWRQGWADFDPYSGYPVWPGHPGYATRNAGLRRLSKLTWRAAEVSAVIAVGFVALFARTVHSVASHASPKPSIHAAATPTAHKQHKRKRHHHHRAALAPPAAAPAPPPPPPPPAAPPPPPPPPVTTSGGSGGG